MAASSRFILVNFACVVCIPVYNEFRCRFLFGGWNMTQGIFMEVLYSHSCICCLQPRETWSLNTWLFPWLLQMKWSSACCFVRFMYITLWIAIALIPCIYLSLWLRTTPNVGLDHVILFWISFLLYQACSLHYATSLCMITCAESEHCYVALSLSY